MCVSVCEWHYSESVSVMSAQDRGPDLEDAGGVGVARSEVCKVSGVVMDRGEMFIGGWICGV